jgi:hypothetical protein
VKLEDNKYHFLLKGSIIFMLFSLFLSIFLASIAFEDIHCGCRKKDIGDFLAFIMASFIFYQAFYLTQTIHVENGKVKRSFLYGLIVTKEFNLKDLYLVKIGYYQTRNGEIYTYKLHFMGSRVLSFSSHFSQSGELINFIRYHLPQVEFKEPSI